MARYGHGTPDDWIERNVYTRYSALGVSLMLIIDVVLFGLGGLAVWALQMAWIPITAAGIINGLGHFWGYRNFACDRREHQPDSPWGIVIGGEELHNNHHTYPTSAKLSVKPYEFDIGWMYITILRTFGLASVKKLPPKLAFGDVKPVADERTLEAIIANRYEVMAGYARELRAACQREVEALKTRSGDASEALEAARRWLPPRRRQGARGGQAATGPCPCRAPGARQDGHHARRASLAVDRHQCDARATGDRPAGLVPPRRREWYRGLARLLYPAAFRARLTTSHKACRERGTGNKKAAVNTAAFFVGNPG